MSSSTSSHSTLSIDDLKNQHVVEVGQPGKHRPHLGGKAMDGSVQKGSQSTYACQNLLGQSHYQIWSATINISNSNDISTPHNSSNDEHACIYAFAHIWYTYTMIIIKSQSIQIEVGSNNSPAALTSFENWALDDVAAEEQATNAMRTVHDKSGDFKMAAIMHKLSLNL